MAKQPAGAMRRDNLVRGRLIDNVYNNTLKLAKTVLQRLYCAETVQGEMCIPRLFERVQGLRGLRRAWRWRLDPPHTKWSGLTQAKRRVSEQMPWPQRCSSAESRHSNRVMHWRSSSMLSHDANFISWWTRTFVEWDESSGFFLAYLYAAPNMTLFRMPIALPLSVVPAEKHSETPAGRNSWWRQFIGIGWHCCETNALRKGKICTSPTRESNEEKNPSISKCCLMLIPWRERKNEENWWEMWWHDKVFFRKTDDELFWVFVFLWEISHC